MIQAIKGPRNTALALCSCSECAAETTFDANHLDHSPGRASVRDQNLTLKNPGMVNKRLTDMGWVISGKRLRCPSCESKRKAAAKWLAPAIAIIETETKREAEMTQNVTDIREPTREQRRDIRAALDLNYDIKAERYIGGETDLTIAQTVGGGCMAGWVARIRDDDYGPEGGNEQIEAVAAQIEGLSKRLDDAAKNAIKAMSDAERANAATKAIQADIAALVKSMGIIKAAVGPKAARA